MRAPAPPMNAPRGRRTRCGKTFRRFARSSSSSHSRNPALGGEPMTLVLAQVRRVVAGLLPLAVVAGCASTDLEPAAKAQLERAQTAYRQAQADPNVQSYAPVRPAGSPKTLQAAEPGQGGGGKAA